MPGSAGFQPAKRNPVIKMPTLPDRPAIYKHPPSKDEDIPQNDESQTRASAYGVSAQSACAEPSCLDEIPREYLDVLLEPDEW
jgi:hypothetical protein